jgi:hypothetical protein
MMRRSTVLRLLPAFLMAAVFPLAHQAEAQAAELERTVIDSDFPGAYQVEVADVNGDKKPDIIAVGGGTCAWYENPTWKKRIVSDPKQTSEIISSATADFNGDGKAEIAIAYDFEMDNPKKGKLALAIPGDSPESSWTLKPIAEVGSIHRLRAADFDGDGKADLIAAPIFGPHAKPPAYGQENASLVAFYFKGSGDSLSWESEVPFASFPVLHAIDVIPDPEQGGRPVILTASNAGVSKLTKGGANILGSWTLHPVTTGAPGAAPKTGSSEVHVGTLADKQRFLTTIEPWHGSEVVCYLKEKPTDTWPGKRKVIDDQLMDGHALWVADVDGDGNDEIFAGHRGLGHRVSMYRLDSKSGDKPVWKRTVIDSDIAAQDLRGGDLDGDGKPDIVAVGGATHNVVWYHAPKANP